MRRLLVPTLLFFAACKPPQQLGGMRVVVSLDEGSLISCVEISAESLDTRTILTSQADVANRPVLQVGITETPSFSGRVRVTVRGFSMPGCTQPASVVLAAQEGVLGPPPFEMPLEFRFRKATTDGGVADSGVDAGFDAGLADAGFTDAGTPDAGVSCDMTSCSSTNECETAACLPSDTCLRVNRPAATPCDGGVCNGGGTCLPPSGCVLGAACDAGLSCTTSGTCSDAGVCVPSFAGCIAPVCMRRLEMCAADGGCAFEVDPARIATSCGSGLVCYANGECQPLLRAANVSAAKAPWPSSPIIFRADAGACIYGWNTTPGPVGAPVPGTLCPWPAGVEPVALTQLGNGPEVIAFVGTSLVVESGVNLRLLGKRPVVFLIHGDAVIEGLVSLRPISPAFPGAGADSAACGVGGPGAASAREGGGGGGFFDMGGAGGRSSSTSNGGAINGNATIEPLRGGCSGGVGWNGTDAGLGGGGLQLSIRGELRILDGGIATPATGGPGGVAGSAAGGGGSGGAILLQAFSVLVQNGFLTANGGAGGEGGTNRNGTTSNGDAGADAAFRTAIPATGGNNGNCCGGNGGPGGAGNTGPGNGTNGLTSSSNEPGGGGGGGSRGRIRIDTASGGSCTLTQSVISPTDNLQGANTTCLTN